MVIFSLISIPIIFFSLFTAIDFIKPIAVILGLVSFPLFLKAFSIQLSNCSFLISFRKIVSAIFTF